uniref:BAG domain-containing protein n=1 Tax=Anas platyrhynchos platyrhynchos TaxID=8840 RepID=A0A493TS24_ANAPP
MKVSLSYINLFILLQNLPENFSDCKLKKKGLVKRVQAFLAQCDTIEGNIGQEMDKLQSKNLALVE